MSDSDPENSTNMIYEYIQDNTTEQESTDAKKNFKMHITSRAVSRNATTHIINHE